MASKKVIFIADSLDSAHKFQKVFSDMDVEVAASSSAQFKQVLSQNLGYDLVVYEAAQSASAIIEQMESQLAEDGSAGLLAIVSAEQLGSFRLPVQVRSDFVVSSASEEECAVRVRQLLWPGNEATSADYLVVDTMVMNLATYQVKVNGEPLDLTYLEYALLAFLATHPGRTYSRDALLRRVWGFDYYGGSRTVDVHVRRVRAKLGPELANRLQTVRGVGYLWSA
ncbi:MULTISPECIES: winged helix family transcriptional regulator [unclassified Adlercreutzia]|uniref:winged helix family transcriptional regulator n=1 Tax=unclassified Adlercreutzia TaxID=2636013 RepID=UPI0013ECDA93|nr:MULTISPECIES: winged helix family transcriptional regulator [unclassified Adlercreutzia]